MALLPGCGQRDEGLGWWEMEQERIRLSHRLELQRYRLEKADTRPDPARVDAAKAKEAEARDAAEKLQEAKARLVLEVAELKEDIDYLGMVGVQTRRERAMGQSMVEFEAAGGRIYHDATILSIGDAGIALRHRDGSARLKFSDLTTEQQEWFGLEPDAAMAAEKSERERATAYERWINAQMVAIDEKRERESSAALAAQVAADNGKRIRAAAMAARSIESRYHREAGQSRRVLSSSRLRYPRQRSTFYTHYHVTRLPTPCSVQPGSGGYQTAPGIRTPPRAFLAAPVSRPPVIRCTPPPFPVP